MNFKSSLFGSALLAAACVCTAPANASTFTVDALGNSSSGGTGLTTISLTIGEAFTVSVNPLDLWNAGALPRWSNADGLTHNLFATGTDESGQSVGTLIGSDFGLYTQGNLTAPYGTLVGQIGSGDYFIIGTSFSGIASATGILKFYYWDSNNGDNTQFVTAITATVATTPLPAALPLFATGLGAIGVLGWRRRRKAARAV
jgi:hypothetical protein